MDIINNITVFWFLQFILISGTALRILILEPKITDNDRFYHFQSKTVEYISIWSSYTVLGNCITDVDVDTLHSW